MNSNNAFNLAYYAQIIRDAQTAGYKFVTLREFVELGCPSEKHFVLRHDLDKLPRSLGPVIDVELEAGVRSTIFVRVAGAEYNPMGYACYEQLLRAEKAKFEIGLHTNFIEFAKITGVDPIFVLNSEIELLKSQFDVVGIATHRDVNYMYNALPALDADWDDVKREFGVKYHAYEQRILTNVIYVNEGLNPHLCWRSVTPGEAIATGRSIYMLTHSHWWFKTHPFEAAE